MAVVKVPSGHSVVGNIDSVRGYRASYWPNDSAVGEAMDPHILEQKIVSIYVGEDAVTSVVVRSRPSTVATRW